MLRAIVLVLAAMAAASGGEQKADKQQPADSPAPAVQQPAAPADELKIGDFVIIEPIQRQNLTVFPIISTTPKTEDHYIILEEGLKMGKVDIYEVGAEPAADGQAQARPNRRNQQAANAQGPSQSNRRNADDDAADDSADVNHLMVRNRAKKPLYLMPGEIIFGGKQDRCVAQECIIPADGKPVKIEVYCVEHGRWTEGKQFSGKAGNLDKAGRAAVQDGSSQSGVWDQVGQSNEASGARSRTGAFTANYTDPKILKLIEGYVKELEQPVAKQHRVIGAMVAVDGKMETVDVFASTPLFQKMWPKLLRGHALDAVVAASRKSAKKMPKPPTLKDAGEFMKAAMEAGVQKKTAGKGLVVTKRDSDRISSYQADEDSAKASAGFGGGVHSSGYSK
jgi:hypothetical protein